MDTSETPVSASLRINEEYIRQKLENCDDIIIRPMRLGEGKKVDCLVVYIEVAVSNMMLEDSVTKEGFSDSVKINSALIRKRVKDTRLKIVEAYSGVRSDTLVHLLYVEDLASEELLEEIKSRLDSFEIDGIMDSGVIQQLSEEVWYSPFPQFQTTERPDRAAMELLNGRIVLICDNSPIALILPTTFHNFMQVSEDRYQHFELVSFLRCLRYLAVLVGTLLPLSLIHI